MTNSLPKIATPNPNNNETLRSRAQALRLNELVEHRSEVVDTNWVEPLLQWEEDERAHRSLQRRIRNAKLSGFKALSDFDWKWPKRIECSAVEDLMTFTFLKDATNVVFIGPNGVGKSTLAQNVARHAIIAGHTVLFRAASEMLGELAAPDSDSALHRRLRHCATPDILLIDEVGHLSYSNRHFDQLFELSRRYEPRSTIVTTNKPFSEWSEVFPNAACVVSLVDQLVHPAEVISIEGESYRLK